MPDITIEFAPWTPGTDVGVYKRKSELHMDDMPPPLVDNPVSGVVDTDGSLTLVDVPAGEWWAIGEQDGVYRYVGFNIQ